MMRRLKFKIIPPRSTDQKDIPAELIETKKLLLFVLRGRFTRDTLEQFSIYISTAYPGRKASVVVLAPDQRVEVYEENGFYEGSEAG